MRLVNRSLVLVLVCAGIVTAYFLATKPSTLAPEFLAYIESAQAIQSPPEESELPSGALEAAEAMAIGAPQEQSCESENVLCVGVVTGLGRVDDKAMNQQVWELISGSAASWSTEQINIQVDLIETARLDDLRANIEFLADSNYDLVVTIGSHAFDETKRSAQEYPGTEFIGVLQQSDTAIDNYRTIQGREREVAFSAVMVAAAASEEGKVGLLLPPVVDPNYNLYESGALEAAESIGVELIITHQPTSRSGSAATWTPDVVSGLLDEGVEVLIVLGLSDERGVLEVAGALESELICIGHGADWWESAEKGKYCLMSSVEIDIAAPLKEMIVSVAMGEEVARSMSGTSSFSQFRIPQARPDKEPTDMIVSLEELEALARESLE